MDGAGCSDLLCASTPGALAASPQSAVPARALRKVFAVPLGVLSPHQTIPDHGPPRA